MFVDGYIESKLDYHSNCAMLQPTKKATIPDLDVAPGLIVYSGSSARSLQVNLSNVTTRPITIPTRATLREIQPINLETLKEFVTSNDAPDIPSLFEMLNIATELDSNKIDNLKHLISQC